MPRIPTLERAELIGEVADVFDDGVVRYSRMTNMKRTLLHSLPAYHALMTWYPLFDTIKAFIGERAAIIFAHAISAESDCLICTTFMRRVLINWGEDPSSLALDAPRAWRSKNAAKPLWTLAAPSRVRGIAYRRTCT